MKVDLTAALLALSVAGHMESAVTTECSWCSRTTYSRAPGKAASGLAARLGSLPAKAYGSTASDGTASNARPDDRPPQP